MKVTNIAGAELFWCPSCEHHLPGYRFTESHRTGAHYCKSCQRHYTSAPEYRARKNERRRQVRSMSLVELGLEAARYVAKGMTPPKYLAERVEFLAEREGAAA